MSTPIDYTLAYSVMRTLTYYDVMDYPMTDFEVWRHLIAQDANRVWSLGEVRTILRTESIKKYIAQINGFYFLIGRDDLVRERMERGRTSLLKTKRLVRYVSFLRLVPFVRMIGLTGRLAMKNGTKKSDLDILIVAKQGHIWMCRLLFTLTTQLMGVRRYGQKQTDRICLNYYITDNSLEVPTRDLFSAHEYSFLVPLFGWDTYEKFVLKNRWIRKYKPHYVSDVLPSTWLKKDRTFIVLFRKAGELCFGFPLLEKIARDFQHKKIMQNPNTDLPGALIIATDEHLVFLPQPHGPVVFEEYKKRFDALELSWPRT